MSDSLTLSPPTLSLGAAQLVVAGCIAKASSMDLPFNISVSDNATHEIAFARMDGSKITSIDVAKGKAFTSAGHRAPTRKFTKYAGVGGPAFGLHTTNSGKFR